MKSWLVISLGLSISISLAGCRRPPPQISDAPAPMPADTHSAAEPPPREDSPAPADPGPTAPLPPVDAAGNYLRTSHRRWQVVDPDPAGLNCRWSDAMPDDWYSPAATWPPMDINNWPVVRQFPTNTELLANLTPAGFATLYDENNRPWLKVSLDTADTICLVRAHTDYIQPIPAEDS